MPPKPSSSSKSFFDRHDNVLLYVPNLIGYVRLILVVYAFSVAWTSYVQCIVFYFLSFMCDEIDGRFARMLNQTSTLGAVLDMVTDRLATAGLMTLLAMQYPRWYLVCIMIVFLDIFSHWFQMYSTLLLGAKTHKDVHSRAWLVRFYYSNRIFMGYCCVACEAVYLSIYGLRHAGAREFLRLPFLPLELPDAVESALPPVFGDIFNGKGIPLLVFFILFYAPGVVVKQICNCVQLQNAVESLIEYDVKPAKKRT